MEWNNFLPFTNFNALYQYLGFILFCIAYILLGVKLTKRSPLHMGVIFCLMVAVLTGTLWPFFVTVWFAFSSIILGKGILSFFKIDYIKNNLVMHFLVGAGTYGTSVGLLAHFPVNYQGVYGIALALPIVLGWRLFIEKCSNLRFWFENQYLKEKNIDWLEFFITVVALIYFVVALMPEISHDALATHLFVPVYMSYNHQWGFDVGTYVWAVMPFLADWIFSIGYIIGGETAARLINVGFIFVLCKLVYELVFFAGGNKLGAKWAVLLFLSMPLTFTESSSLYIESVWTAFVIAGTLAIFNVCTNKEGQKYFIPLAGMLLGFALAAKVITVTVLPVLLMVLIFRYKVWLRAEVRKGLIIGLSLFILIASVPYVTSWLLTENPIFPFFNSIFKSPYYPLVEFNNARFNSGFTWDILYQIIFNSGKYLESSPGVPGFHWLTLFIPSVFVILINRHRQGLMILIVGVLSMWIVFQFQSYLRYIFPSFLLFTVVIGISFSIISRKTIRLNRIVLIVGGITVCFNILFLSAGANYKDFPLSSILTESSRESYLENRLPIRNAVQLVNKLNKTRTPVAVFSHPLAAGLNTDALYPNWYNHNFNMLVNSAKTERSMADMLKSNNVEFVVLDKNWGSTDKRQLITMVTEEILDFGNGAISVRTLRREYRKLYQVQSELLKNPDLYSLDGWGVSKGAIVSKKGEIVVNAESLASQVVSVMPKHRYVKTIKSRCHNQPGQGRLQINWLDSNSKFISVDIRVFDCTKSLTEQSMKVVSPPNSALAVIYAAGHTNIPIVFKEIHFSND